MRQLARIFVEADTPEFAESSVTPEEEVFDLNTANVKSLLEEYHTQQRNYTTAPFDHDGQKLRFFPGGFSVWSGSPGAGKTTLLRQLACHLLRSTDEAPFAGVGVFVCSLEESPQQVLIRHAQVAWGSEVIDSNRLQWCSDLWADRLKLWKYRPIEDHARYRKILAAIRILARSGVRHAIIDSLMCLDVGAGDWEGQRQFANALYSTCALAGVHIHLVAHPRKPIAGSAEPDLADVAGSSDLARRADNVIFVCRAKDEAQFTHGPCTPMRMLVRKQRHGTGWIGEINGLFHRGFRQFVFDQFQPEPTRYLPNMAYQGAA